MCPVSLAQHLEEPRNCCGWIVVSCDVLCAFLKLNPPGASIRPLLQTLHDKDFTSFLTGVVWFCGVRDASPFKPYDLLSLSSAAEGSAPLFVAGPSPSPLPAPFSMAVPRFKISRSQSEIRVQEATWGSLHRY